MQLDQNHNPSVARLTTREGIRLLLLGFMCGVRYGRASNMFSGKRTFGMPAQLRSSATERTSSLALEDVQWSGLYKFGSVHMQSVKHPGSRGQNGLGLGWGEQALGSS